MIRLLLLFLSLALTTVANEPLRKTEIKFVIKDLMEIPPPILEALKSGKDHPDIIKRGFVVQEYLAVTKKNIMRVFKSLEAAGIAFGGQDDFDTFIFPGKTQEIRLMQKCIKEKGEVKDIYQISMFGPGGLSCTRMESPEQLDAQQQAKMLQIFDDLRSEVSYIVRKVYFELVSENSRTAEVDMFLNNIDGKLVPVFIDGEIKFPASALEEAYSARHNPTKRPAYFSIDITDEPKCKTRNIALIGVPAEILASLEESKVANFYYASKFITEYKTWASPHIVQLVCTPPIEQLGPHLNKKVLLNAEAFGFGPTAAIAEFFPYLRDRIAHLSYIGTGHTLDLQSKLPYDNVFDYRKGNFNNPKANFQAIAKDYDVLITASDFEVALWAKELGLKVIIYDPLTWYWRNLPEIIHEADFYVAQNFFGVSERLIQESSQFPENTVVPAIISGFNAPKKPSEQETLLVNMGGLSNPFLQDSDLITFANIIFGSVREVLEPEFHKTYYVTSKTIANAVKEVCPATSMLPHQVQGLLNASSLSIMTSGLGNIYEASSMQKFVIWLPPANDSQGQQIKLLSKHNMTDYAFDWHDILEGEEPIDYFAPQEAVLQRIAACMQKLKESKEAQNKLKALLKDAVRKLFLEKSQTPALNKLADAFEVGGAKQAAESIIQYLHEDHK